MSNDTVMKLTKPKDIEMEKYSMDLQLSDQDREKFINNPIDFLKELLEKNGRKVNRINADKDLLIKRLEEKASFEWLHFVYPDDMASEWRYVYIKEDY